jgi:hypothetical protein
MVTHFYPRTNYFLCKQILQNTENNEFLRWYYTRLNVSFILITTIHRRSTTQSLRHDDTSFCHFLHHQSYTHSLSDKTYS